jgi:hypothetical protein
MVEDFLDKLARAPAQPGDFQELDTLGRHYQTKALDEVVVTWWVDHAAREVRVVEIEAIDQSIP